MAPGPWGGVGGGWGPRDGGWGRQLLAAGPRPVAVGLCGGVAGGARAALSSSAAEAAAAAAARGARADGGGGRARGRAVPAAVRQRPSYPRSAVPEG